MVTTENVHHHDKLEEALASLRAAMSPEAVERADRLGRINSGYVKTLRDHDLGLAIDSLVENAAAMAAGVPEKRRALFLIGESGSGKTTAIKKHLRDRKVFQPRVARDGETVYPMVSFDAPKPLTLKLLAKTGLQAIGYPVYGDQLQENQMWDLFRQQLKERRVMFLHIDEMQHVIRGNKHSVIQDIADTVKSLLQIPEWPLHVIFSGVPTLAKFLQHEDQLNNRSIVLPFDEIRFPDDVQLIRKIVKNIIEVDAALIAAGIDSDGVIHRLIHGAKGGFGTIIQFVRASAEGVMRNGGTTVTVESFARTYSLFTGSNPQQNVFTAKDWASINPANALAGLVARHEKLEEAAQQARKPRKA